MCLTRCTICGELLLWPGVSTTNALCAGCAPNLAASEGARAEQAQGRTPLWLQEAFERAANQGRGSDAP
jgi:hypothetical protein